jgi:glucosamine 6-phosphate synthetase-like amidotransferase/phosphosugar isomerase protein
MCGIVGLFLKDETLEPVLGDMLTTMLVTMTDRGPDSAGIAIYGPPESGIAKITVQSDTPARASTASTARCPRRLGGRSRWRGPTPTRCCGSTRRGPPVRRRSCASFGPASG